jgi:hypothetical protein
VASGRYQPAEFAADHWQVYRGEGSDEYKHPTEFYRRTFIAVGLKRLLIQALLRLNGNGGDPVAELQTNFGGGKTHSILALYRLFTGKPSSELPGVEELVKETGVPIATKVRRTVFVGTQSSPGRPPRPRPDTVPVAMGFVREFEQRTTRHGRRTTDKINNGQRTKSAADKSDNGQRTTDNGQIRQLTTDAARAAQRLLLQRTTDNERWTADNGLIRQRTPRSGPTDH